MSVAENVTMKVGPGEIQLDLAAWAVPVCGLLMCFMAILLVLTCLQWAKYQ
jgi:hypothetical protein